MQDTTHQFHRLWPASFWHWFLKKTLDIRFGNKLPTDPWKEWIQMTNKISIDLIDLLHSRFGQNRAGSIWQEEFWRKWKILEFSILQPFKRRWILMRSTILEGIIALMPHTMNDSNRTELWEKIVFSKKEWHTWATSPRAIAMSSKS